MAGETWRVKRMELDEWSAFQERFGDYQMATGAPEGLAMFAKKERGETGSDIYVTGPDLAAIEGLGGGGWSPAAAPEGEGVSLLVGSGDPWSYFNINK